MSQTSAARTAEEFSAIYRAHYWTIVTFLRRRGDTEPVARDLTAEVFTVAWRRRSEEEATLPWLYGIARMTQLAHVRSEGRRRRRLLDRLRHYPEPTAGGEHDLVERIVLVRGALRRLPSPRITLPPASSADVLSGQVHHCVLRALLSLSASFTIGVSVLRSGHPTYVFGTGRHSDHARGRAVDTWQIDGHAVVSPATPRSLVVAYMQAAAAAGSDNVGGPYLLSGSAYFSDATHHDHVHAGFRT